LIVRKCREDWQDDFLVVKAASITLKLWPPPCWLNYFFRSTTGNEPDLVADTVMLSSMPTRTQPLRFLERINQTGRAGATVARRAGSVEARPAVSAGAGAAFDALFQTPCFFARDLLDDPAIVNQRELEAGFGANLIWADSFDGVFQAQLAIFLFFALRRREDTEGNNQQAKGQNDQLAELG
jgi:hypothetical protein